MFPPYIPSILSIQPIPHSYSCSSLEIFLVLLSGIFLCVNIFLSFLYIYKAIKILRFSIYHFPFWLLNSEHSRYIFQIIIEDYHLYKNVGGCFIPVRLLFGSWPIWTSTSLYTTRGWSSASFMTSSSCWEGTSPTYMPISTKK